VIRKQRKKLSFSLLESRLLLAADILVNTTADENDGIDAGGVSVRDAVTHGATHTEPLDIVKTSYIDGRGTVESVTSAGTAVNGVPTGTVTIAGVAEEGQVLTASNDLADEDGLGVITYQWNRDTNTIVGATSSTYTLTQADVGAKITVTASYTDDRGTSEAVTSDPTASVENVNDLPTGAAEEGQVLTASNNLTDEDELGTVSYQWNRDGVAVTGATDATFMLTQDDVGLAITATVSYTDQQGTAESVISDPTAPVANVNDAPGLTISGTPTEDQTLTVELSDEDGTPTADLISYQWNRATYTASTHGVVLNLEAAVPRPKALAKSSLVTKPSQR